MRNLVTIRQISNIEPIPGADNIDVASVDGWKVVVKKGDFQIGDPGLYFEIDSWLPWEDERFRFLIKDGDQREFNGVRGVRLRTVKLRGQVSQGLLIPLRQFPEIQLPDSPEEVSQLDFADALKVQKWEPPVNPQLAGQIRGNFPYFIPKTDEERVQNLTRHLWKHLDDVFECTIKLDGASMTVYRYLTPGQESRVAYVTNDPDQFVEPQKPVIGVCSRNLDLLETEGNALWKLARVHKLIEALEKYGRNIALQGEIIGNGIQGNNEELSGTIFCLFNIYDIDNSCYLPYTQRKEVAAQLRALGADLSEVPLVSFTTISTFGEDISVIIPKILEYADGPSLNAKKKREGVVFKKLDGSFSFKAISNAYLLKEK